MNTLAILGLSDMTDDMQTLNVLLDYVVADGQVFPGYRGMYFYNSVGWIEYIFHALPNKDGKNEILGFSNSAMSNTFWKVRSLGMMDEPEPQEGDYIDPLDRAVSVEELDGEARCKIRLIHSDCVPSLAPGELLYMQVIAMAESLEFYPDKDSLYAAHEGMKFKFMGKTVEMADGIFNLCGDEYGLLIGTITKVEGVDTVNGKKERIHLQYVYIDTQFGELPVVLNPATIDEEQRKYIREGACLFSTAAVINGDVAINEYQGGAVRDGEHFTRLIRDALICGSDRFQRLLACVADDGVFTNETGTSKKVGPDAIGEGIAKSIASLGSLDDNVTCDLSYADEDITFGEWIIEKGTPLVHICSVNGDKGYLFATRESGGKIVEIRRIRQQFVRLMPSVVEEQSSPTVLYSAEARDTDEEVSMIAGKHNVKNWHLVVLRWLNNDSEDFMPLYHGLSKKCVVYEGIKVAKIVANERENTYVWLKEVKESNESNWHIGHDERGYFLEHEGQKLRFFVNKEQKIQSVEYSGGVCV